MNILNPAKVMSIACAALGVGMLAFGVFTASVRADKLGGEGPPPACPGFACNATHPNQNCTGGAGDCASGVPCSICLCQQTGSGNWECRP
jgi:hypothetical protein